MELILFPLHSRQTLETIGALGEEPNVIYASVHEAYDHRQNLAELKSQLEIIFEIIKNYSKIKRNQPNLINQNAFFVFCSETKTKSIDTVMDFQGLQIASCHAISR